MPINVNYNEHKKHNYAADFAIGGMTVAGAAVGSKHAIQNMSAEKLNKLSENNKNYLNNLDNWKDSFNFKKANKALTSGKISKDDMNVMIKFNNFLAEITTSLKNIVKIVNNKVTKQTYKNLKNAKGKLLNVFENIKDLSSDKKTDDSIVNLAKSKCIDFEAYTKHVETLKSIGMNSAKIITHTAGKGLIIGAIAGGIAGLGLTKLFDGGHKAHHPQYRRDI